MTCCEPGGLTRRSMLKGLGAAGLLTFGSSLVTGRAAFADTVGGTDTLVVIFLRAGADWLSIVPPVGDPDYATARPTIAVPASRALQLDSMFGLHPAMAPLLPWWSSGQLGFVHAAGSADPTRSHFDAQAAIEAGAYGTPDVYTGWLDRFLAGGTSPFQAVQRGTSLPASLDGTAPALAMSSLAGFTLPAGGGAGYAGALTALHAGMTHPVAVQANATVGAVATAKSLVAGSYVPANGAVYPSTGTGPALLDLARLIKAGLGLKVATLDIANWDMHAGLGAHGAVDSGWMRTNLVDLASSLAAFATDLGSQLANVSVVTVTDFGRRVAENGNGGVDHGHGQAMMLLGGGTRGGRVWGQWPTLAPGALTGGADLAATTDLRSVFGELLVDRMGASDALVRNVFPGWTPTYLDAIAPR